MISTTVPAALNKTSGSGMLRSVDLIGPAGRLEALLNEGVSNAKYAALVCHPHPQGGGTLHNKVVYHAMKALNAPEFGLGYPVLRFNFRGTGLSEGRHDAEAETGDVLAAIQWLRGEFGLPIIASGFSFGAAMCLRACCTMHDSVAAVTAFGLPLRVNVRKYDYSFLTSCSLPKLFLSGDRDIFAPAEELTELAATTAEPKTLVLLPGADHFFAGQLETMQNLFVSWLKEQVP